MDQWINISLNLLLVLFLVGLNGFFVAVEFAMVRVRGSRLTELAENGNKRAKMAKHVSEHMNNYLSACQLGITLASLGLGWVGEPAISHLMIEPLFQQLGFPDSFTSPVSFGIAFAIITFLHIVLGELAPKSLAIFRSEGTSLWLSGPLMVFYRITYPAIWFLNGTANRILRWFGIHPPTDEELGHTEEEIRILMKESHISGHIDDDELTLVENIFDFTERVVREVMVPRTMMECLYTQHSFEENFDVVKKLRHTRYPLADSDKDHIVGIVHAIDLYEYALNHDISQEDFDIQQLARPIHLVPEMTEVSQVLRVMQKTRAQMVIIVDEYGGTAGLVTMEDIIEEIIGDIQNETEEDRKEVDIFPDHTSVDGRIILEKINDLFDINLDDDDVDTLAGWMYKHLERTPKVGDRVNLEQLAFEVEKMDSLRIERITIHAVPNKER